MSWTSHLRLQRRFLGVWDWLPVWRTPHTSVRTAGIFAVVQSLWVSEVVSLCAILCVWASHCSPTYDSAPKPAQAPELSPVLAPVCEFPACPVLATEVILELLACPVLTTVVTCGHSVCPDTTMEVIPEFSVSSVATMEVVSEPSDCSDFSDHVKSIWKPLLRREAMSWSPAGVPWLSTRGHSTPDYYHSVMDFILHNPLHRHIIIVFTCVSLTLFAHPI